MLHLIIGGEAQGKLDYALRMTGLTKDDVGFCQHDENPLDKKIIDSLHCLVERLWRDGIEPMAYIVERIGEEEKIVICNEIGCGIVPVDAFQRQLREITGSLCCQLARRADKVERIFCGLPITIKNQFHVSLIRHGKTPGNHLHQYIGRIDESLSSAGVDELKSMVEQSSYPKTGELFVSPMKRCLETRDIIYPDAPFQIRHALREMDFGQYDGMTFTEISALPGNEGWGMTDESMIFPGGEIVDDFKARCKCAFLDMIASVDQAGASRSCQLICHGGVIMAIMEGFVQGNRAFHQWRVDNGCGYEIAFDLASKTASVSREIPETPVA